MDFVLSAGSDGLMMMPEVAKYGGTLTRLIRKKCADGLVMSATGTGMKMGR